MLKVLEDVIQIKWCMNKYFVRKYNFQNTTLFGKILLKDIFEDKYLFT